MGEELEFRRRLAEHEARFARPRRAELGALATELGYRGCEPGVELWARAIAAGCVPVDWADDPLRRFRATRKELLGLGQDCEGPGLLPSPARARAGLLFASDPGGMAEAEALARALARRFEAWGGPSASRVVWRLAGNPVASRRARPPSLVALAPAVGCLRAVLGGAERIYEPPHPHRRFQPVVDALFWSRRWRAIAHSEIPARVGGVAVPAELVGRSLAELDDPLEPWLALARTGYIFAGLRPAPEGAGFDIHLHAPYPAPGAASRKPGRPGQAAPRAVWSQRLTGLRLACVRGDFGQLRAGLPLLAADDEVGEPRLAHFGAFGGARVLELLAEHGRLELEARDAEGQTPLMLAAALPRSGPAGASPVETEAPLSELIGAEACRWLLAAGADADARDRNHHGALHLAARARRADTVRALLEEGVESSPVDHRGRTPLMLAVAGCRDRRGVEVVEALLGAGADADRRDLQGRTALHYAATATTDVQPALVRALLRAGARPSRDRGGYAPSELGLVRPRGLAAWEVAAGPGRPHALELPAFVEQLLDELAPSPEAPRAPASRDASAGWMVLADWLLSRGDPRGELVATSLRCARMGRARRRAMAPVLAELEQRCHPWTHAALECADPLWSAGRRFVVPRWTHGFVTAAEVPRPPWQPSAALQLGAVRVLLELEPLLAELRVGAASGEWPQLLATLREGPPCRLRRLILPGLPRVLPELQGLERRFPAVHTLWLLGADKLRSGVLRWPGLRHLRVRHGSTSEWREGNVDLRLELPQLTQLDLAAPVGSRTGEREILGVVETLLGLPSLEHLRLGPLGAELAAALLPTAVLDRLRILELVGVRGSALDRLLGHVDRLRGLERLRVSVTALVAEQRAGVIAQLRRELPQLQLEGSAQSL